MSDERTIDESLKSIRLPEGLDGKLRPEALFDDAAIDRMLAGVTVPAGLAERIHAAASSGRTAPSKNVIDLTRFMADAGHTPNAGATPVLRPARRGAIMPGLVRDFASVATALGLVGVLALAGVEFSRRLEGVPAAPRAVTRLDFNDPIDRSASDRPLHVTVPAGAWPTAESKNRQRTVTTPLVAGPPTPSGTASDPAAGGPTAGNLALSPTLAEPSPQTVRGAPVMSQAFEGVTGPPSLATVEIPTAVRRRVPRVRGYDLAFEMTTGEQPFVDPAADPALAVDCPPLTLSVDGFEAVASADHGRRPRIRTEDILAAMPARHSSDWGSLPLQLVIHEVPGLRSLGEARGMLVEVAVSARPMGGTGRPSEPLNVTLVLDQSAAGDSAAWGRICRAVGDLAAQLAPSDRVSVVLAGPRPRMAVQAADPTRLAALAADLEWQGASITSDLDQGLILAGPCDRVVVVAHAMSLENGRGTVREALAAWHNALALVGGDALSCEPEGGTRFIVLDPSTPSPTEWKEPTFGRTSPDAVSIRRALIGQVTGRDTLVASHCDLQVRFDPRRVARYRLVGHRQSAVESLAEAPPRGTDIHVGETVRVVYEVIPRSNDIIHGLASASLTWRLQQGDARRIEIAPNHAPSPDESSLPSPHGCELILATGLGELASGSAHLGRRPALVTALQQLISDWRSRGDITPFGETLARSLDRLAGSRVDR